MGGASGGGDCGVGIRWSDLCPRPRCQQCQLGGLLPGLVRPRTLPLPTARPTQANPSPLSTWGHMIKFSPYMRALDSFGHNNPQIWCVWSRCSTECFKSRPYIVLISRASQLTEMNLKKRNEKLQRRHSCCEGRCNVGLSLSAHL